MSRTPDRPEHEPPEDRWLPLRLGEGRREPFELANAVEWDGLDEGRCYIYPADASDTELKTRWLAVPACLLVDLEDAC